MDEEPINLPILIENDNYRVYLDEGTQEFLFELIHPHRIEVPAAPESTAVLIGRQFRIEMSLVENLADWLRRDS